MIDIILQNSFLINLVMTIRIWRGKFLFSSERKLLSLEKKKQKTSYKKLIKNFSVFYEKIKKYSIDKYVTSLWKNSNKKMERLFLPFPKFDFLSNPELINMMFMSSGGALMKTELDFLENKIKKEVLKEILKEEYFGCPLISDSQYISSHNSIHHLYHLLKYEEQTGKKLSRMEFVIDWGGGYGNLAKIFRLYTKKNSTYIIIDTPLFSCLQWLYLSIVLGEDQVVMISNRDQKIIKSKINILPLGLLKYYKLKADLFLSTWALSESTKLCQLLVKKQKFFSANHLLMSFHESCYYLPDSGYIRSIFPKEAKIEEIHLMKGNYYAFI